jgi:phosphoribosylaminoimidazole carboxylase (NCAIR synthetase)
MIGYGVGSTAFAGLAITLVVRREYGMLKRIRATPLPAPTYLAAMLGSTLLVFAIQTVVIVGLGVLLFDADWPSRPLSLAAALLLAAAAFAALGGVECVLEERLALETELSVVLARGDDGAIATFPVGENRHREGILETTVVPARIPLGTADEALATARRIAGALDYVGVLGVEMFVANGGRVYVNEIAPRPHNSGHYTLDACSTDQFEQQLRALCGLPLAEARLLTPVAMVNLLGDLWQAGPPRWDELFRRPGVRLHLYGKTEPRPGRKMGHLNCLADNPDRALAIALEARDALVASPTHAE